MQINMKKNVEKRRNTGANRTPTPRMGYTRIEPEAGGAASLAALCNMTLICRTRGANRRHVESRQRSGDPPTPRVLHKAKNTKEKSATLKRAAQRSGTMGSSYTNALTKLSVSPARRSMGASSIMVLAPN